MAQVVETSGADVEEAVDRALRQLGLTREQVDVDVVREGRKGFLGFGSEEAIVRVTAKPGATPAAGGGRRRGRRGGRGRGDQGRETASGGPQAIGAPRRTPEPDFTPPDYDRDELDELDEDDIPTRPTEPSRAPQPAFGGGGGRSRGGRGGRGGRGRENDRGRDGDRRGGRGDGRPSGPYTPTTVLTPIPGAPEDGPTAPPTDAEDQIEFAGRTLRDLLTLLGLTETEITARDPVTPGDGVGLMAQVFDINGLDEETSDELGVLIGRRGETLQSLQYLLNVIVSSQYDGEQIFGIDVEQYRQRREQSLVELARRIAAEVRATGDVITLEPMPPAERRIIHLALQEEEGVYTESVGDGDDRQVEILPR